INSLCTLTPKTPFCRQSLKLLDLPQKQHNVQLSAISRLHEGSGTFFDLKIPKAPIKGRVVSTTKPRATTRDQ
ncbi:hypothetical protein VP01_9512g1, partial [Puccinia sorghi]